MNEMKINPLPVLQLCVSAGLSDGYRAAHSGGVTPSEDDLICAQYHAIMHQLRVCFQFNGIGFDEEESNESQDK